YDFLARAAVSVRDELSAGLGAGSSVDSLIADPAANATPWTANDLKARLLGKRHDLIFLNAHFTQSDALAADYSTRLQSSDLLGADLTNAIVWSGGCHTGYNTVDQDSITGVTSAYDFAEVLASKGATLISGTGYQYGDTDFIEYSQRLY